MGVTVSLYRVVRASILYFEDNMKESRARYDLIKPFMLLVDSSKFKEAKEKKTEDYRNICDILKKMNDLYVTGEAKYHHFNMLLSELKVLGFDINYTEVFNTTCDDRLNAQISLLQQFLAFRYPFDQYDNKTGVHDAVTGNFIFIQP